MMKSTANQISRLRHLRPFRQGILAGLLILSALFGQVRSVPAAAPATKLFPEKTFVFLRISDARVLRERLQQMSFGQLIRDPQFQPLASQIFGTLGTAFKQVEEQIGASLDEILSIPQGEIALGVAISPYDEPMGILMVEAGDSMPIVNKLIAKGASRLMEAGFEEITEKNGNTTIHVYSQSVDNNIAYFQRDGKIIASNNLDLLKEIDGKFDDGLAKSFASNPDFGGLISKLGTVDSEDPLITWYIDPLAFLTLPAAQSGAGSVVSAFLPTLGLDGFAGIGGGHWLATAEYDSAYKIQIMLDSPRNGVIDCIAFKPVNADPEPWVPAECASYMTAQWDFNQTFKAIARMYDSFQQKGAFSKLVADFVDRQLGFSLEKELLPVIDGRISMANWVERPVRINSQVTMGGIKLKDPAAAKSLLDKVIAKFGDNIERKAFGANTIYMSPVFNRNRGGDGPDIAEQRICVCLIGEDLLIADRSSAMEKAITTLSDPSKAMKESLEYKIVSSRMKRMLGDAKPAMITFSRPEESLRFLYDLAGSQMRKDLAARAGQRVPLIGELNKALEDHPLPPFTVVQQYFAPGGGYVTDEKEGITMFGFSMRRKGAGK